MDKMTIITARGQQAIVDAFIAFNRSLERASKDAERLHQQVDKLLETPEDKMNDQQMNGCLLSLVGNLRMAENKIDAAMERVIQVTDEFVPAKLPQFERLDSMCEEKGFTNPYPQRFMVSRAECNRLMSLISGTIKRDSLLQEEE